ncbi:MAG: hypothetical protein H7039_02270 [Bryobacteraceae bacterium]|nr:hypothetical protein [Bryobacteraceae bacterium]
MNDFELGTFSFTYRSLSVHGMGISASSNFAVLYEASQLYLRNGAPVPREEVAKAALLFERRWASKLAVAADDVYPITYGGMLKVITEVDPPIVRTEQVPFDPCWIADHVVVAFDPYGKRHEAEKFLERLVGHRDAKGYVEEFSDYAATACEAMTPGRENLEALAGVVNKYRESFDKWTFNEKTMSSDYTHNVRKVAEHLMSLFHIRAWKPPGAGASKSLILITEGRAVTDAVVTYLTEKGWWASPAIATTGICGEFVRSDRKIRITAGHRIDFIGAADLGQDERINTRGICCSCAVEPRTMIVFESTQKRHEAAF